MKRIAALCLSILTVLSLLTACALQEPAPTLSAGETAPAVSSTAPATSSDGLGDGSSLAAQKDPWGREWVDSSLPANLDFGKEAVNILVEHGRMKEVSPDALTDEVINDALYRRNAEVEADLNVTLNFVESRHSQTKLMEQVEAVVNAGTNDYDIVMGYSYFMAEGVRNLIYANLSEMPCLDFTKPWWNQTMVKEATVNEQMYAIAGDFSLSSLNRAGTLYFNKTLADEIYASLGGSDHLYRLVQEGKWTVDEFTTLAKLAYRDLNEDDSSSFEDLYGYGIHAGDIISIDSLFFGMGGTITRDDENGVPQFTFSESHTTDVFHKIFQLFYDCEGSFPQELIYSYSSGQISPDFAQRFVQGQQMFYSATLADGAKLSDMSEALGLLPMPKYDQAQAEYRTTVSDVYLLIQVPSGIEASQRAQMVGATLEKLAEESYRTVRPALFQELMGYEYLRSEETCDPNVQSFDLLLEGICVNFGSLHSQELKDPIFTIRSVLKNNTEDWKSSWELKETEVLHCFQLLVDWYLSE